MTKYDLVIKNCLMVNPDFSISEKTTLLIKDGRIAKIAADGLDGDVQADQVLDGSGKLAMPGLVDGHTHSAQQLLRGSVIDELPMVWARILVPFESSLTPEDVYAGSKLFCIENLKAGTTAFAESGGPFMEATAQAALETGIRGAIAYSTMDYGEFIPESMKSSAADLVEKTEKLYKDYHGAGSDRIHVWFALRQVMTSTPDLLEAVSIRSKELNTGVHTHLAEHLDEVSYCLRTYKKRPAEVFDQFGLMGPNLIAAHSVRLSDREVVLVSERKANPVHCPSSNLRGHGFSKTPLMLALNTNIGLGTDGAAGTRLNLFAQMRLLKTGMTARYGIEINDPLALPILDTLRMATSGGAKALMLEDQIGTLEVGKKADIILLDIDQPHISPTANLIQTVVMVGGPDDVNDVIVDGKLIIKDRKFLDIDEEAIRHEAAETLKRVAKKAGLAMPQPYFG